MYLPLNTLGPDGCLLLKAYTQQLAPLADWNNACADFLLYGSDAWSTVWKTLSCLRLILSFARIYCALPNFSLLASSSAKKRGIPLKVRANKYIDGIYMLLICIVGTKIPHLLSTQLLAIILFLSC